MEVVAVVDLLLVFAAAPLFGSFLVPLVAPAAGLVGVALFVGVPFTGDAVGGTPVLGRAVEVGSVVVGGGGAGFCGFTMPKIPTLGGADTTAPAASCFFASALVVLVVSLAVDFVALVGAAQAAAEVEDLSSAAVFAVDFLLVTSAAGWGSGAFLFRKLNSVPLGFSDMWEGGGDKIVIPVLYRKYCRGVVLMQG